MEVKFLEKMPERVKFSVEGITYDLAGELRRIMISEIPTMAVEWVDFHKNDSVFWDEIIAHRIGLIPLTFNQKSYKFKDQCSCGGKGCVNCHATLVLKKKGPCMVYSGDFKIVGDGVRPVYDNIPIVELMEDQELELEAFAELGLGKKHAKWQGAIVGYKETEKGYIFDVESVCGLKPEEVVLKALDILDEKLKEFSKKVQKLK